MAFPRLKTILTLKFFLQRFYSRDAVLARVLDMARYLCVCVCVCLSLSVSVTSQCSIKKDERIELRGFWHGRFL